MLINPDFQLRMVWKQIQLFDINFSSASFHLLTNIHFYISDLQNIPKKSLDRDELEAVMRLKN